MDFTDAIGLLAAGLVLATFSSTQMRLLRLLAIGSNLAFIAYGLMLGLLPIWVLHGVLLPLNLWHLFRPTLAGRRQPIRRPQQP